MSEQEYMKNQVTQQQLPWSSGRSKTIISVLKRLFIFQKSFANRAGVCHAISLSNSRIAKNHPMLWEVQMKTSKKQPRESKHSWSPSGKQLGREPVSFHLWSNQTWCQNNGKTQMCKPISCDAHQYFSTSLMKRKPYRTQPSTATVPKRNSTTRHTHNSSILPRPKNAPSISLLIPLRCIFKDFKDSSPWNVRLSTILIRFLFSSLM